MTRGLGFTIAWASATIVAVVIAAAAVSSVRSQVTDTPTALGAPTAVAIPADTPPADVVATAGQPTTTVAPVDSATVDSTSTTTPPEPSSAPTTTVAGSAPTTTTSMTATTTTTAAVTWTQLPAYTTRGGDVIILVSGESVKFGGAQVETGWTIELEKAGPPEVEVHFERNEDEKDEVEFHAKFEDGELVVVIS